MTTMQLVLRDGQAGPRTVDAVANPKERAAASFESGTQRPLVLGPQELLEFCVRLADEGFTPTAVSIVDSTFTPVRGEYVDELETELIAKISEGSKSDAIDFYVEKMLGYYVLSINMRDTRKPEDGAGTLAIGLNGVVQARNTLTGERAVKPFQRAYSRWVGFAS